MSDDIYIKMILALPEDFFKNWKWAVGDKLLNPDKYKGEAIIIDEDLIFNPESVSCVCLNSEYTVIINLNNCIPVPNQRQLQDIILQFENTENRKDPYGQYQEVWILSELMNFVDSHDWNWMQEKSMECIVLEYLMHLIYQKKWNGGRWI